MAPTKSLDECEKLAKNIKQIRKNIRKKHQTLTQNVIDEEKVIEKSLKPVTEPLQKLVQEKTKQNTDKHEESMTDIKMEDIQPRLKRASDDYENQPSTSKRLLFDPEFQPIDSPSQNEETVYESLPTVEEVVSTPEGRNSASFHIDTWLQGPLIKRYIEYFIDNLNINVDRTFGPYLGNGNTLMLGKYPITFEGDDIIINDRKYTGTPGLYELIFMKRPDDILQTEEDLLSYAQIINETAAHTNLLTKKLKGTSTWKYKYIIKPNMIKKEGRGFMKITKPNYIHWDDVNELCERLHLLISSRNAGHSGHNNEILSIIEELHEAGIIKENVETAEAVLTK